MFLYIKNFKIKTSILDILNELKFYLHGAKLRQIEIKGDEIRVTCPFHKNGQESKPSCFIYIGSADSERKAKYGTYHCFTCGESGPFEKFVAGCLDSSVDYAIRWLLARFPSERSSRVDLGSDIKLNLNSEKFVKSIDPAILEEYQDWCPYLAQRGLSREICKKFGVKYDPETRNVIFPCYDLHGNLVMLHKRSIDTKMFYLDKDVEKPIFGLDKLVNANVRKILITEGPFDALKANQFGFPACATLGMLTESQIEQINATNLKSIYIMFDNDDAGESFKRKLKSKLKKTVLVFEPKIPNGKKDIGDLNYDEFWNSINNC